MKAMLLALAVIVVVIGVSAYVVHTDPNRAQTRAAFDAALGYLDLKNHDHEEFSNDFSVDQTMKQTHSWIVQGALLRQDYLLRQAEYKLAQIRSIGGNTTSRELEEKRLAYANATRRFQKFWDAKLPGK